MSKKRILLEFATRLSACGAEDVETVLKIELSPSCDSFFYFPFEPTKGSQGAAEQFWVPLFHAFPDLEIRPGLILDGTYEGREHASLLGFVAGNFMQPFCAIPPTKKLTLMRFAINAVFEGEKIVAMFVMFDLIDLMRSSGFYPFRAMPGSSAQWPFSYKTVENEQKTDGRRALEIIREMQHGLPAGPAVIDRKTAAAHHSPHWAKHMNWFGPAGIGSSRGMEGFRDSHGALFLRAFPDRQGLPRAPGKCINRAGHFCEIGDGRLAMTAGWPVMRGRHTGSQWLGLPPTGVEVLMRVADWYRIDSNWKIADNWVMIDIPHILNQMGLNVFEDLPFAVDPTRSRLP